MLSSSLLFFVAVLGDNPPSEPFDKLNPFERPKIAEDEISRHRSEFKKFLLKKAQEKNPNASYDSSDYKELERDSDFYALEYAGLNDISQVSRLAYEASQVLSTSADVLKNASEAVRGDLDSFSSSLNQYAKALSTERSTTILLGHLYDFGDLSILSGYLEEGKIADTAVAALGSQIQNIGQRPLELALGGRNLISAQSRDDFEAEYFERSIRNAEANVLARILKRASAINGQSLDGFTIDDQGLALDFNLSESARLEIESRLKATRISLLQDQWFDILSSEIDDTIKRLEKVKIYFAVVKPVESIRDDSHGFILQKGISPSIPKLIESLKQAQSVVADRKSSIRVDRANPILEEVERSKMNRQSADQVVEKVISARIRRLSATISSLSERVASEDFSSADKPAGFNRIDSAKLAAYLSTEVRVISEILRTIDLPKEKKEPLNAELKEALAALTQTMAKIRDVIKGPQSMWGFAFDFRAQDLGLMIRDVADSERELLKKLEDFQDGDRCYDQSREDSIAVDSILRGSK